MSRLVTIRYRVRRKFKAGGRMYEPGDEWEPTGDPRKDERMVGRFVELEISDAGENEPAERPAVRSKRGAKRE